MPQQIHSSDFNDYLKGTLILFQFLFLMEKSILYAKIHF